MSDRPDFAKIGRKVARQCGLLFGESTPKIIAAALEQTYAAGLAAAQQWRPISEAPKDGTDIIIYPAWSDGPGKYRSGGAHWHNGKRVQCWESGGLRIHCEPTLWQPLPPPPPAPQE